MQFGKPNFSSIYDPNLESKHTWRSIIKFFSENLLWNKDSQCRALKCPCPKLQLDQEHLTKESSCSRKSETRNLGGTLSLRKVERQWLTKPLHCVNTVSSQRDREEWDQQAKKGTPLRACGKQGCTRALAPRCTAPCIFVLGSCGVHWDAPKSLTTFPFWVL